MTSELEKQFFQCFGIEPKELEYPDNFTYYPEITDRILLELICILSESPISIGFDVLMLGASDVDKLKGYILLACMGFSKDIKQQVRTLFEVNNNDR